jgi:2,3-bisphosphoglycerate-dependent phosphoglycerate mutase
MPQLVLIRHGESQWNLENRFTGWVDVPLTAKGEEEARAAGEKLRSFHFDCAFTSGLMRAQHTLRIVLETIGQTAIPIKEDVALNERMYGELQGLNKAETAKKFGDEQVKIWRRSFDVRLRECFLITRVTFTQSSSRRRMCWWWPMAIAYGPWSCIWSIYLARRCLS